MKKLAFIFFVLGTFTAFAQSTDPNSEQFSDNGASSFGDAGSFYNTLTPYGEWLEVDPGFYAWRPTHVGADWRPYMYGRWAWTDYGWYWVSNEPFGWAVFHYGRWYFDDNYGWLWIPDRTWAPAWVEWRYNDDYLGWAPLPPYASFSLHVGIRFTTRWFAPYRYWNFVRYRSFGSSYMYREILPIEYSRRLIGSTRTGGRYDIEGDRIINRGIDRTIIDRRGGYTRTARVDLRGGNGGERFVQNRDDERIVVYRPDRTSLSRSPEGMDVRRTERGTSLEMQRIERPPREATRPQGQREPEGTRPVTRENVQPPQERYRQPETSTRRDEQVQRPRNERRISLPQGPSVEHREPGARNGDRNTTIRQEQRHENQGQHQRVEQRSAPSPKQESSKGNEQNRREGGKRRD